MALVARRPLADAKWALRRLNDTEDLREFRILWAATVALLRAVGHVLDKVDSGQSSGHQAAIKQAWTAWKSDRKTHTVFWNFIERERNTVLKEYEFGYELGTVELVATPLAGGDTRLLEALPPWIYVPLMSEDYAGEDARDIAQEAIDWWELQLENIETAVRLHSDETTELG